MTIGEIVKELAATLGRPVGVAFSVELTAPPPVFFGVEGSVGFFYDELGNRHDFVSAAGLFEAGYPGLPPLSVEGELIVGAGDIDDLRNLSFGLEGSIVVGGGVSLSPSLNGTALKLISGTDVATSLEAQYTFFSDEYGFVDSIFAPFINSFHDFGPAPYAEWQLRGSLGEDVGSYDSWAPAGAPPAPDGAPTDAIFNFLTTFGDEPSSYTGTADGDLLAALAPGIVDGGDGDDTIFALNIKEQGDNQTLEEERQELRIDAGAGNDWVYARGAAEIILGTGDDVLLHAGKGSVITTGTGEDTLLFSPGTLVTDADGYDRVAFGLGLIVPELALSYGESESSYAYAWGGLIKVGFNDAGEMVVGTIHSDDSKPEDFMYFANGNSDPLAAPEDLTAGIRVGHIEIHAYWLQDLPEGISSSSNDDLWAFMHAALKDFFSENRVGGTDPLVLDLDGDGLELSAMGLTGGLFDMDGDQFAEPTGWVYGDDGLLAIDLDGNGLIDDISELFGHDDVSGFAELAALDSNADGVIDASDTAFDDLVVWQDADGDSVTDQGELQTLDALGITSIGLTATDDGSTNGLNVVARTGTFTWSDGSTGTVGDVEFRIDNYDTVFLGDNSVDPTIAATMPNLKGHGTLTDLHVAMTLEGSGGQLETTVNSVLPTLDAIDLATLRARALPILEAWAAAPPTEPAGGNPDVPVLVYDAENGTEILDFAVQVTETITLPDDTTEEVTYWKLASGAAVKDAQDQVIDYPTCAEVLAQTTGDPDKAWDVLSGAELDYLERYFGEDIPVEDARSLNASAISALSDILEKAYHIIDLQALRLAMQGPLAPYFAGVEYDPVDDGFKPTTDGQLVPMLEAIFDAAPGDAAGDTGWLQSWEPLIDALLADYKRGGSLQNTFPFVFTTVVAAAENVGLSISVKEAAVALGLPEAQIDDGSGDRTGTESGDIFYLSSGDDVVHGGQGADVYVVGANFGDDVIDDYEEGADEYDTLRFAHLSPDDVTLYRQGRDLLIVENATGDTVTVIEEYHDILPDLSGNNTLPDRGINEIVFADGTVWTRSEIALAVSHPTAADETIEGTDHIDVLDGGGGNDILRGGNNTDIYVFGRDYGTDRIEEDSSGNILISTEDILRLGPDIERDDLHFARDGDDLILTIDGTSDQLTIAGQFAATYTGSFGQQWFNRIETFIFDDGQTMSWDEIARQVIADSSTDGDDVITGYSTEDTLDGGAGDDYLSGGNENDIYYFGLGYGHDTIEDNLTNILSGQTDKVIFRDGIALDDVTFVRDANGDLEVTIAGATDKLTIVGQFDFIDTGPFGIQAFDLIESFEFADGTSIGRQDVMEQAVANQGTAGDDSIHGFYFGDRLDGGAGNDILYGHKGDDVYVFGRGYGDDIVDDNQPDTGDAADAVEFVGGLTLADVTFAHGADPDDLLITTDTGDTLTLKAQFTPIGFGWIFNEIEEFRFEDGTTLTSAEVRQMLVDQLTTSGDDVIDGSGRGEIFHASAGDDVLNGLGGPDIFEFGPGSGHDTINASRFNVWDDDPNAVHFAAGVAPSDVEISRDGLDAVLTLTSTGETLRLTEQFGTDSNRYMDSYVFADGTEWTRADLIAAVATVTGTSGDDSLSGSAIDDTIDGLEGNDTLSGMEGSDQLFGGAGDDVIHAGSGDDVLEGGTGDDQLYGSSGTDVYVFGRGDGHDIVDDSTSTSVGSEGDAIQFGPGLTAADVTFSHGPQSGEILVTTDTGDTLTLVDQFTPIGFGWIYGEIEEFRFEDGTTLTSADVRQMLVDQLTTSGDDVIDGSGRGETFHASAGDDVLNGWGGGDIYEFGPGSGHDTINESRFNVWDDDPNAVHFAAGVAPSDIEISANGDDLVATLTATGETLTVTGQFGTDSNRYVESFVFADGTTWTRDDMVAAVATATGTSGDDTIEGLSIDDTIVGLGGDDFLDGKGGNDRLLGGDGNDTVWGGGGNDVLTGGLGDDHLDGSSGSDTYIYNRGDGDDVLNDNRWTDYSHDSDRIVFADIASSELDVDRLGDGSDLLLTIGGALPGSILVTGYFLVDHRIENIQFSDGVTWGWSAAQMSALYLADAATSGDDVIWGFEGVAETIDGGDGNDTLYGYSGDDTLIGGNGNDVLYGHAGSDVLVGGDGDDYLMGGADADSLDGGAGNDTADYSDGGTWVLDLSAGTATSGATVEAVSSIENIKAGGGADTLIGDAGDNILTGGYGSDLYRYGQGGGYDEIVEVGFSFDTDTLELVGLNEADVVVSRTSSDLILTTVATGETITVTGHFWDQQHGIETLRFADGTEWGRGTMAAAAWYRGTDGDDTITGTSAAETFDGGAGDDLLNGGSGNDRYVWGQGSGNDTIAENAFSFDTDTLELVGLNADDVVLERSIGVPHLSVTILATGETISVSNHFWGKKYGIEQIHFADGTIWDQGTISNNTAFLGTAGDDTFVGGSAGETVFGLGGDDFLDGKGGDDQLFGGTGADTLWADAGTDTLTGGLGNDHLDGSAGSDIYVYNRGDGDDVIADYRWYDSNDSDRIVFTDIASNEVAVSRADGGSDLLLIVGGATPGSIWVNDHFQSGHSIELFEFADGVTMTLADMAAATADTMAGSSADDTMVGSSINDTFYGLDGDDALDGMGGADQLLAGSGDDMLTGGGGDDLLSGGTGADTFIFGAGFGNDIITDFEPGTGGSDVIEFDDGLFDDFADLLAAATQVGDDVVITWDADNVVTLKDVDLAALHQEDFQFAA